MLEILCENRDVSLFPPTTLSIQHPNLSSIAAERYKAHHIVFVLHENAEFLQEGYNEDQQLEVLAVQRLHQHVHDVLVPHLQLDARVLSQVQEQVNCNYQRSMQITLRDHNQHN